MTKNQLSTDNCPQCSSQLNTELVRDVLEYATPDGTVNLPVTIPSYVCNSCGFSAFGQIGEKARTEAIYAFRERITPWEIVAERERLGLTQLEFANLLGVGHASLERWETGETIQTKSMDNLILLLSEPSHARWLAAKKMQRVERRATEHNIIDFASFRALVKEDAGIRQILLKKAGAFRLRRA